MSELNRLQKRLRELEEEMNCLKEELKKYAKESSLGEVHDKLDRKMDRLHGEVMGAIADLKELITKGRSGGVN